MLLVTLDGSVDAIVARLLRRSRRKDVFENATPTITLGELQMVAAAEVRFKSKKMDPLTLCGVVKRHPGQTLAVTVAVVREAHLAQRIVESRPTEDPVIRVASSSSQPRSTSISCDVVGRPGVEGKFASIPSIRVLI